MCFQILWADSGWKPIPLAEIIEANAVKKAYQRALLCLHPDKLQQKGATPYQKVIAQKLFDILQVYLISQTPSLFITCIFFIFLRFYFIIFILPIFILLTSSLLKYLLYYIY